jgi:TolA-binding protein
MNKSLVATLVVGGLCLGLAAGCTPKPSEEQLQELNRVCAAADQAESSLEQSRREMTGVERQLAQSRRNLQERQQYLQSVRTNVEGMQSESNNMDSGSGTMGSE